MRHVVVLHLEHAAIDDLACTMQQKGIKLTSSY